ncbi:hypothetical protein EXIGLDRAFT_748260 [Exidia glandulosa HHB12029]|uniref:F-box domain-containing protein n=1 Tax=Exidia glandulosa HHB12029 TaxID=1314781 RepID=A0A165JR91_EXIGL|nr:hypothetical protein EXIGLDRAFT_748260 [Exidia glandulosa HHB12029]
MSKSHHTIPVSLLDCLALAVQRIFEHAHRKSSGRNEALSDEECLRVAAVARAHFDGAIAAELHERNAERMRRLRLPGELWVEIWSHLPMRDIVTASHVCHLWRSLALASPSLWSTLEVVNSRHHEECRCKACQAVELWDMTCKGCRRPVVPGRANTELVRLLVPRSKSVALSCFVDAKDNSDRRQVVELAGILAAHRQRLVHLDWGPNGAIETLADFLQHFDALPVLRSLTMGGSYADVQFSRNIRLPSLQQLSVCGSPYSTNYYWSSGRLVLPSVTRLEFRIISADPDGLISALEMVPNARTLDLRAQPYETEAIELDYSRVTELASTLTHVHVHDAYPRMHQIIMALYTQQLHAFTVEVPWWDVHYVPGQFCHIFSGLQQGVRLSIRRALCDGNPVDGWLEVKGTDSEDNCRHLGRCPRDTIHMLWTYLSPSSLSALSIDAILLADVLGTHTMLPAIHEMTLNIDVVDSIEFSAIDSIPRFPDLRVLWLTGHPSFATPVVSAGDLALFVANMHIGSGLLDELVFENVEVEGEIAGVAALVRGL